MPIYLRNPNPNEGPGPLLMAAWQEADANRRAHSAAMANIYGQMGQQFAGLNQDISQAFGTIGNAQVGAAKIGYDIEQRRQEQQDQQYRFDEQMRQRRVEQEDQWKQFHEELGYKQDALVEEQRRRRESDAEEAAYRNRMYKLRLAEQGFELAPSPEGMAKAQELMNTVNQLTVEMVKPGVPPDAAAQMQERIMALNKEISTYATQLVPVRKKPDDPPAKPWLRPDGTESGYLIGPDGKPFPDRAAELKNAMDIAQIRASATTRSAGTAGQPKPMTLSDALRIINGSEDELSTMSPQEKLDAAYQLMQRPVPTTQPVYQTETPEESAKMLDTISRSTGSPQAAQQIMGLPVVTESGADLTPGTVGRTKNGWVIVKRSDGRVAMLTPTQFAMRMMQQGGPPATQPSAPLGYLDPSRVGQNIGNFR